MDTNAPRTLHGDILIQGDRIMGVGGPFLPEEGDLVIDGSRCAALPGLINAHTHLAMTLLRNCADDMDLFTWLHEYIWPREAKLTEDHILWGSYLGLLELIRSGTTLFADMYFHQQQTIEAVLASGLSASIGATMFGDMQATQQRLPALRDLWGSFHGAGDGRIMIDAAPHAVYTCTKETLQTARDLAEEYSCSFHIHISESKKENSDCLSEHGKTPTEYLDSLNAFSVPVYAAHCVHLSDRDINIFKHRNAGIVHNPTSNLKLANGFAPVHRYIQEGLNVGLGTDGASSNNNLNMMEEMHIASLIQKACTEDPRVMEAYQVLEAATIGGARVLGRDHDVGTLEAGKRADIILVHTDVPHLHPLNNPISAMVYSAQSSDITTVISSGRIIMENRRIVTLDEEKILHEALRCAQQL